MQRGCLSWNVVKKAFCCVLVFLFYISNIIIIISTPHWQICHDGDATKENCYLSIHTSTSNIK